MFPVPKAEEPLLRYADRVDDDLGSRRILDGGSRLQAPNRGGVQRGRLLLRGGPLRVKHALKAGALTILRGCEQDCGGAVLVAGRCVADGVQRDAALFSRHRLVAYNARV
jgi:hypothetical protein